MHDILGDLFIPNMPENGLRVVLMLDSDNLSVVSFGTFPHDEAEDTVKDLRFSDLVQSWTSDDPHGYFIAAIDEAHLPCLDNLEGADRASITQMILGIHIAEVGRWSLADS